MRRTSANNGHLVPARPAAPKLPRSVGQAMRGKGDDHIT